MLIDSHAHLDFPDFSNDLEDVLRRAEEAEVKRVITIGTSIESSRRFEMLPANGEIRSAEPPASSTRWHGTTIGKGLRPSA